MFHVLADSLAGAGQPDERVLLIVAGDTRTGLARSTHVKGIGRYVNGVEIPRVEVMLATGSPEALCDRINLGYLDPASVCLADYENREDEGILVVPNAGEMLHRLSDGTVPGIDRLAR